MRVFPGVPSGWYAVATSRELRRGRVLGLHRFGRHIAVFRTESGRAAILDGHCPHLGADLGRGKVAGEHVVCPFHQLRFGADGACGPLPACYSGNAKLAANSWPVIERDGFVLAWFDEHGAAPSFDIPTSELAGYRAMRTTAWTLRTHTQEIGEGSVDLAHLCAVHRYTHAIEQRPIEIDGATLRTSYRITRGLVGDIRIAIALHGLGFSTVDVELGKRLRQRAWILATPIDRDTTHYRVALAVNRGLLSTMIEPIVWRLFVHDVKLDFPIWENKTYLERPRLLAGDGPIGAFRRWTRQFYARDLRSANHAGTTTSKNPSAPPPADDHTSPAFGPSDV